ncbi:tRNA synthetases class I (M)-domain-containing protein [Xylariaceae sp. FL1272]|nr:tRNA synthetases class I (M)-domain-containing protein [Xylariaceae sp. FL1272]
MESFLRTSGRRLLRSRLSQLTTTPVARNGWVCQSCRSRQAGRMRFSSNLVAQDKQKPYYVTTPIFYVNASPHVGHLYSMLIADVLKRWEALKGHTTYLTTGTDEHGMKVQQAAKLQDMPAKALCDANSETFKDLARKANISNDHFIRTTDTEHRDAVEFFWARLRDSGYIYETKHEGWYCVSDETFYPETMVEKRMDSMTGKIFTASIETGNAVEWTEEKNYHFRLTAFRDRLLKFYKENPEWVVPSTRFNEVIEWVTNHLEDLSISRPVSRLDWGIPVPEDPSQTIYVWLDALVNYLTTTGYPVWPPHSEKPSAWPADVQVVGKDIVRFHCIYWPAFLMAIDLPLPKQVLSHGHWLMGERKMSKSIGNVVNPFFALDRWGVDTMRYFLIYSGHVSGDSDYNNQFIVERYEKGLRNGLGNLLNRVTRPKHWSVRQAVEKMTARKDESFPSFIHEQRLVLETVVDKANHQMKALNPSYALQRIMDVVMQTNKFFSDAEPWAKSKKGDVETVDQTIFFTAESLRIVGILLQPFIPEKAAELLDRLGVSPERRSMQDAVLFADSTYGTPLIELGQGASTSIFPPMPVVD